MANDNEANSKHSSFSMNRKQDKTPEDTYKLLHKIKGLVKEYEIAIDNLDKACSIGVQNHPKKFRPG